MWHLHPATSPEKSAGARGDRSTALLQQESTGCVLSWNKPASFSGEMQLREDRDLTC